MVVEFNVNYNDPDEGDVIRCIRSKLYDSGEEPGFVEGRLYAYVGEINDIAKFIEKYGWEEGYRNNMAVNLTICFGFLGIPIARGRNDYGEHFFYDWLATLPNVFTGDINDLKERAGVVAEYADGWHYDLERYGFDLKIPHCMGNDDRLINLDSIKVL